MRAGRIDPHARDLLLLPHGNGLAWPLQDDDDVGGLLGRAAIGINDRAKEKQLRTGETIIYLHGALRYIRSEEHTSELQSLMRISYAVFCLKKKITTQKQQRSPTMTENQ